jgi:hypothetical protein
MTATIRLNEHQTDHDAVSRIITTRCLTHCTVHVVTGAVPVVTGAVPVVTSTVPVVTGTIQVTTIIIIWHLKLLNILF